jgi:Cu/Ag efflux pump CusA
MGIAVIGGLAFGSALTLFVIPTLYVLLYPRRAAAATAVALTQAKVGG